MIARVSDRPCEGHHKSICFHLQLCNLKTLILLQVKAADNEELKEKNVVVT